jgi:hypothetical protein
LKPTSGSNKLRKGGKSVADNKQFVTNEKGERVGVLLPLDVYQRLVDAFEELEDIRAYDEAKTSGEQAIPFEQATKEIERSRE